jgi:hypothetical protein
MSQVAEIVNHFNSLMLFRGYPACSTGVKVYEEHLKSFPSGEHLKTELEMLIEMSAPCHGALSYQIILCIIKKPKQKSMQTE